ncbi:MAG: FtsX-like permease family protein [Candidatus Eisenbacteria bacterium]|nr:FtsX-like permease family protein [Candidatus Eisenbacteria bacterium]
MSALVRWLLLRRLALERGRTLLTICGIALGVAVFVSIRLANHSAMTSFADTVDAVTGRANLSVQSAADGFADSLFVTLARHPGVEAAAPIVQVTALAWPGGPRTEAPRPGEGRAALPAHETLLFLGVDPLSEAPFARFGEDAGGRPRQGEDGFMAGIVRLIADPRSVAVTRSFADRLHLRAGDTLTVLASGRPVPLVVALVLEGGSLREAAGGAVAVMDIATAQEVFGRAGRLDRVELLVPPADRERLRRELTAQLPGGVIVEPPRARTRQVENMVAAFALNLTALSFIALLVSMFLVFNAVAMSVLRWRREIGILRGLGVTRAQVVRLFLLEGLLLGAAGSALGTGLGTLLARATLGAVGRTLTDLYLVQRTSEVRLDPWTFAVGFGLGIATALLSALAPAIEASWTPPALTMRQGTLIEARRLPVGRWALVGIAVLALAGVVVAWTLRARQPWGGFAAAFLVVAAFTLVSPAFTLAGERLLRRPALALAGIEGALGVRALRDFVARTSVVVASLMLAVGMTVALSIMVGSFRRTVDMWITQSIRGDLYVEPAGHRASQAATALPDSLVRAVAGLPGVIAVDTYRATPMRFEGRRVSLTGIDFAVQARHGSLRFVGGAGSAAVLERALRRGEAVVTESFAHRFRVAAGDTIRVPAAGGKIALRVAGVFYDYTTDAGAILVDRGLFARLMRGDRTESLALYTAPGTDLDLLRSRLAALAGPDFLLNAMPNRELRRRVLTVFDQTFRITFALQFIAVLVAVLGVVTTLTALILQRGREIGILRATGALRSQVRRIVLIEGGVLGLLGSLLGCAAGVMLALLLVHVINRQYFGWTIRMAIEPGVFAQAVVLMVGTSLAASLAPARYASERVAAESLRVES